MMVHGLWTPGLNKNAWFNLILKPVLVLHLSLKVDVDFLKVGLPVGLILILLFT